MEKRYIIKGGKQGDERLKKLIKSTWKNTEYHVLKAGLKENMSVLDVACGSGIISKKIKTFVGETGEVTAFDFDPQIIEIAKTNNNSNNINFFIHDISQQNLDYKNKFDFIFVRFFLSHIPNPNEVLQNLNAMLKTNGILYVEDVDFSGYFSYPQNNAFDKYVEFYQKISLKRGGNPFIGKELYEILSKNNFNNTKIYSTNTCFTEGVGKEIALITFEAILPALISENYTTQTEGKQIILDLKKITKQENSIISLPRIFHCFGRK